MSTPELEQACRRFHAAVAAYYPDQTKASTAALVASAAVGDVEDDPRRHFATREEHDALVARINGFAKVSSVLLCAQDSPDTKIGSALGGHASKKA